ncbi:hypothetical protein [Terrabacter sp. MAHUQ-38]|uniref:hypothetical protein n=1 Tax=unclassified Terrabacter TaxID=2630222 RepID=UPI00165E00AB|nr:hypothetical protein [Terrabacter sp. MAHUQ-38]MBC9819808.1 hypothetical protein [Terrabacter sp. MAHUQ-38]
MSVPEQPSAHHSGPGDGGTALSAPIDTAWRRLQARVPVVRGRVVGTALALAAVLCAAPTTIWPTHTISYLPLPDMGGSAPVQQIAFWSWGRIANIGVGADDDPLDLGNPAGLLLLSVALLVGVVAGACYALRRGSDGVLLGIAGTSWLTGHLSADVGQTAGRLWSDFYGGTEGIWRATTVVGLLQLAAIAMLLAALAAMAWRPAFRLVALGWARAPELVQRVRARSGPDETAAPASAPRVGIATIRDLESGSRPGRSGAWSDGSSVGWGDGARSGVGFSDEPGSDPDRFRPPP